jgi:hypothetical protein
MNKFSNVKRKILGLVERSVQEGFYLAKGCQMQFGSDNGDETGFCLVGLIAHKANKTGKPTYYLTAGAEFLDISVGQACQLEAGFEGWTHYNTEDEFYKLGNHIRETYAS